MTWPGLTQDFEHGLFIFHLSRMSYDKEGAYSQEIWLLPHKIAECDNWVMVCVDLVGPFTIRTPSKAHSLLALTTIDPEIQHRFI
jgi:hypothetical protein